MRPVINIFIIAFVFTACSSPLKEKDTRSAKDSTAEIVKEDHPADTAGHFKAVGDSIQVPEFKIKLALSDKAEKELRNKKESIIVTAYFSGIPKDTAKYMEDGQYAVGACSIELTNSREAIFESAKISKTEFESLANKDFKVLINIYSGRRSSPSNLLNCDILEKNISEIKGREFILNGKLIGE